jgi:hypothetical protein
MDYTYPRGNEPLNRVFEIARAHGIVCVLREVRYIDAGWRSQLARFYNATFRRYPSVCHRLHFFTSAVAPDLANLGELQTEYRGYTVLRPIPLSPVGKTMIVAPPELDSVVRNECTEEVNILGYEFKVTSMPFMSQDTQFLRCAHASLWMVLQHGHLKHGLPLRLPAEIYDAATGGVMVGRQLPSDGLSSYQIFTAMVSMGLSPTQKPLPRTREDNEAAASLRLFGMLCRYINSSLPPIVISQQHAWVVVAYSREGTPDQPKIILWRHDDARGPYMRVEDPWNEAEEAHRPWLSAYLPLLPKAFLDAERAELVGRAWYERFLESGDVYAGTTLELANEREYEHDHATLRTYLVASNAFKIGLAKRSIPEALAAEYRISNMPRYIWVVEVIDRQRRNRGEDDVIGEILLDATLTQYEPLDDPTSVLAMHIDNFAFVTGVDQAPANRPSLPRGAVYGTGCPVLT